MPIRWASIWGASPRLVTIEFQPEAAPYVAEREYHPSQSLELRDDGCLVLKMRVAVDFALSAWVLGFGPRARVLAPRRLAQVILEQIEDMRANYAPTLPGLAAVAAGDGRRRGCPSRRKRADLRLEIAAAARSSIARCAGWLAPCQFVAHPRQRQASAPRACRPWRAPRATGADAGPPPRRCRPAATRPTCSPIHAPCEPRLAGIKRQPLRSQRQILFHTLRNAPITTFSAARWAR